MRLDGAAAQYAPNLLTNPGFEVWQHGTGPFTGSLTDGPDRWFNGVLAGGGAISVGQDSGNADVGSRYDAAVVFTVGTANVQFIQRVGNEPLLYQIMGRTVTASVRAKTSTANALRLEFWNSVAGAALATGAFHPGDGAYHTLTLTVAVPTGATWFDLRLTAVASCTAYLDNAALVVGSQPVPYTPLHPADDLLRCQRYYELLGDAGSGKYLIGGGYAGSAGQTLFTQATFQARKAVAPTLVVVGSWTGLNATGPTVNGQDTGGAVLQVTSVAAGLAYLSNTGAGACISAEANP